MAYDSLYDEVRDAIAEILKCSPIELTKDISMSNYPSWDSLAHVEIMMVLNEKAGIKISADTLNRFTSFFEIEKAIKR